MVPITYVFKEDHIYGHTKEGKKIEMMRKNAMVCFEVDHIVDMRNWQSAVIQGEYEELKADQADQAMGELINRLMPITTSETGPLKYGMQHPHPELISTAKPIVFKIHILEKSGRYEKS